MSKKVHPLLFRLGVKKDGINLSRSTQNMSLREVKDALTEACSVSFTNRISSSTSAAEVQLLDSFDKGSSFFSFNSWSNVSYSPKYSFFKKDLVSTVQRSGSLGEGFLQEQHIIKHIILDTLKKLGYTTNNFILWHGPDCIVVKVSVLYLPSISPSASQVMLDSAFFSQVILAVCSGISSCITGGLPVELIVLDLQKKQKFLQNLNLVGRSRPNKGSRNFSKEAQILKDIESLVALSATEPVAQLVANYMASILPKTPKHQRILDLFNNAFSHFFEKKDSKLSKSLSPSIHSLKGVLLQVKGRVGKSDRSKKVEFRYGSIPLSTVGLPLDCGFSEALTFAGVFGIKVLFRFESLSLYIF